MDSGSLLIPINYQLSIDNGYDNFERNLLKFFIFNLILFSSKVNLTKVNTDSRTN